MKMKLFDGALLKQSPVFDTVNIPSASYLISLISGYLSFYWINNFISWIAFIFMILIFSIKVLKRLTVLTIAGLLICFVSGYMYSVITFSYTYDKYSKFEEKETSIELIINSPFTYYDTVTRFEGIILNPEYKREKCIVTVSGVNMNEFNINDIVKFSKALITPVTPYNVSEELIYTPSFIADGINFEVNIRNEHPILIKKGSKSLYSIIENFKSDINGILYINLEPDQYSFISGIVTGYKDNSNEEFYEILNDTGISHTVVVSGMHFSIIISVLLYIMRSFTLRNKTASVITGLFSVILAFFYGFTPSVLRTLIMTNILAYADFVMRDKTFGIHFLSITAIIMILFNPFIIYDVAFILSFGSVAGIKCFSERIAKKLGFLPPVISSCISVTLSANLITLPFTLFYFNRLSFGFLFGNLIVTPFMSLILIYSVFATLLTSVFGFFSYLFIPLNYALKFIFASLEYISSLKYLNIDVISTSFGWIFLYFSCIALFFLRNLNKIIKLCSVLFLIIILIIFLFIPNEYILFGQSDLYAFGKGESGKAIVISGTKTIITDLSDSTSCYQTSKIISKKSRNNVYIYITSGKASMTSAIKLSKNVKIDYIIYPDSFTDIPFMMEPLYNTGVKLISTKEFNEEKINDLLLTIRTDNNYNIMEVNFSGKQKTVSISCDFNKKPDINALNILNRKKLMLYKYNDLPVESCVINNLDNNLFVECIK